MEQKHHWAGVHKRWDMLARGKVLLGGRNQSIVTEPPIRQQPIVKTGVWCVRAADMQVTAKERGRMVRTER